MEIGTEFIEKIIKILEERYGKFFADSFIILICFTITCVCLNIIYDFFKNIGTEIGLEKFLPLLFSIFLYGLFYIAISGLFNHKANKLITKTKILSKKNEQDIQTVKSLSKLNTTIVERMETRNTQIQQEQTKLKSQYEDIMLLLKDVQKKVN